MSCLTISPRLKEPTKGCVRYAADVYFPDGRQDVLWFEVAEDVEVTTLADPFAVGMLFEAMALGVPLKVNGEVSAGLLWRLEEFMAIWSQFLPARYRSVPILVRNIVSDLPQASGRLSTFSGGSDSCFTAFRHAQGSLLLPKIDAGLMVHGFDIPLEDSAFERALSSSQEMLASLGMQAIWMRTNIREVNQRWWPDIFGSALVACLHLLSPKYGRAYIPSSFAYSAGALINGSNALTDPLLGSDALQIIYDGAIYTRNEKLRFISNWPEAMRSLRVCWEGNERDGNCCRCEKCIRNMLNFKLEGLPVPPAFSLPLTPQSIRALRFGPTEVTIWKLLNIRVRKSDKIDQNIKDAINSLTKRMVWRNWRKSLSRQLRSKV